MRVRAWTDTHPTRLVTATAAIFVAVVALLSPIPVSAAVPVTFLPTGLDGGGLANAVAFDPWTPGVVIAGGDNSGIFRSTDYGQTWSPVNTGVTDTRESQVADIEFSPTDPGTLYAAVGSRGAGGGLLVSTDEGLSWHVRSSVPQFSGNTNNGVPVVPAAHPRSTGTLLQIDGAGGHLYAATFDEGVMRSSDDGVTWETLGLAGEYLRSLAIDPSDPDVLFASTYGNAVWETTTATGAGSFTRIDASPAIVEDLAFVGTDLYAVGPGGLFRTTDGGASWVQLGAGQLPTGGTGPAGSIPTWFTVTGFQACGQTTLYVGGQFKGTNSVMISHDAGASWASMLSGATMQTSEGGPGDRPGGSPAISRRRSGVRASSPPRSRSTPARSRGAVRRSASWSPDAPASAERPTREPTGTRWSGVSASR